MSIIKMKDIQLTRRSFLQAMGLGALSLALPTPSAVEAGLGAIGPDTPLGRILWYKHMVHTEPNLAAPTVGFYRFDEVIRIPKIFYTENKAGKKIGWYQLGKNAFINALWVQPVFNRPNAVVDEIPEGGCLGEITVPKTPVYRPDGTRNYMLDFYYETTFWVLGKHIDDFGVPYYELLDDLSGASWYVRASAVRMVTKEELSPISPDVAPDAKRIELSLSSNVLRAYEYDRLVFETVVTTGEIDGSTPIGRWYTNRKRPCRHMINEPNNPIEYNLPGVPWVMYITLDGVAMHGAYWHTNWGTYMSNGCINLRPMDSKWLYRWTSPDVPFEKYYEVAEHGTQMDIITGY